MPFDEKEPVQAEPIEQGFASAFNSHMDQWYRESGVDRIELTAMLANGGYTWASAGYDWDGDERLSGAAAVIDRLRVKLDDLDNDIVKLQDTRCAYDEFVQQVQTVLDRHRGEEHE